jgi:hypothetical protein
MGSAPHGLPAVCIALGLATASGCTQDFDRFEPTAEAPLDSSGADGGGAGDGGTTPVPAADGGASGSDAGADACASVASGCAATAKGCGDDCRRTKKSCEDACPNGRNGRDCRARCGETASTCGKACRAACETCEGACVSSGGCGSAVGNL